MYSLGCAFIGKNEGNFRYSKVDRNLFLANLKIEMNKRKIKKVFAPVCQFTTKIERFGREENEQIITPWFIRTKAKADGGTVAEPDVALAVLNADCPVVILFDREQGYLTMLHAGLRCLVPEDPFDQDIISRAFEDFNLNPKTIEAIIAFGAGPCCYGIEHIDELKHTEFKPFIEKATRGPREGQKSLNLIKLIRKKLHDCGVEERSISSRNSCTACFNRNKSTDGHYHSNIYDGESAGRNLVLAWFYQDQPLA